MIQLFSKVHGAIWALSAIIGLFVMPMLANQVLVQLQPFYTRASIAPLFTPQIQYWEAEIARWSDAYQIDPNLMATIMQIESCGHPNVVSHAGAQGLFQVMPFHFAHDETMLDPDTNAYRSANFINECTGYAQGDIGLVLACYNGGPSVVSRSYDTWAAETQRYYVWGSTIYGDAMHFAQESIHLDHWLAAGGTHLCNRASHVLGLP